MTTFYILLMIGGFILGIFALLLGYKTKGLNLCLISGTALGLCQTYLVLKLGKSILDYLG